MSIRPIDIQVNVTGSNQVSEMRHKEQQMEQLHQQNPQGLTQEIEKKLTKSVNEVKTEVGVDPDAKQKEEEKKKKKQAKEKEEAAKKNVKAISDGIRGKRIDFSA